MVTDQAHLALTLEISQFIGAWDWDVKQDCVRANAEFARIFSVDPQMAAAGVSVAEFFKSMHPNDRLVVEAKVAACLKNGGDFAVDYRLLQKDGTTKWVFAKGCCYLDENGEATRFPGVAIDITERKEIAADLKHVTDTAERQRVIYETALSNTPDLVYIFDLNARFTYANKALLEMFGRSWEETIDKSFGELGYADWHAEMHEREIAEVIQTKKPIRGEVPFAGMHGRRIYDYIFSPVFNAQQEVIAIAGTTRDVTERKQTEDELKESRAHLSLMVESAKDYAIISMNLQGRVISWNKGAERIFGYLPEEIIGNTIDIIFTPEDRAAGVPAQELTTAQQEGQALDERWHLRKNGERFYVSGIMTAMYNDASELHGFTKIARDMTMQKQAEEQLIEARNAAEAANLAKSEFLANMSHEIRTPMNAIIGLTNILALSQPLTPKQKEFLQTLQMSADSLLGLINDLLDIAKIEARTVELEQVPFSVTQIVQEVTSMMAMRVQEKGLVFTGVGTSQVTNAQNFIGDPTRLRQIVLNLCSNAVKFTEQGSVHVEIDCHPTADPHIENICIMVKDTGIGIAPDKLATIFEKFVQADTSINRKYGGTGLGLAITKTLVEIMGGSIQVESVLGQGSTFRVYIPLQRAEESDILGTNLSLPAMLDHSLKVEMRPHVLLVEDYAANVLVATTFLEGFGYQCDVASNGIEAIEMARTGNYFAILMDVQMHGMNGFEATSLIREYEKQQGLTPIPIIGMTAHALAGDRERCLSAGMSDYIAKPFNPDELKEKLEELLAATK